MNKVVSLPGFSITLPNSVYSRKLPSGAGREFVYFLRYTEPAVSTITTHVHDLCTHLDTFPDIATPTTTREKLVQVLRALPQDHLTNLARGDIEESEHFQDHARSFFPAVSPGALLCLASGTLDSLTLLSEERTLEREGLQGYGHVLQDTSPFLSKLYLSLQQDRLPPREEIETLVRYETREATGFRVLQKGTEEHPENYAPIATLVHLLYDCFGTERFSLITDTSAHCYDEAALVSAYAYGRCIGLKKSISALTPLLESLADSFAKELEKSEKKRKRKS